MPPVRRQQQVFRTFDPLRSVALSLRFLTGMVDRKLGCLPYGTVQPWITAPFAEHSRQDDAEHAATWFDAISCAREMLGTDAGQDVQDALREIVLDPECWDKQSGLRFPRRRPWSDTPFDYCVVTEQGPVLAALARMLELDPGDERARECARSLVNGLHALALPHERRLTPGGAMELDSPTYSFPSDVVVRGSGPDPSLATGYSDNVLRILSLLHPLMAWYAVSGDETALDLATGLGNWATGVSHPFGAKSEFHGEVHSALVAAGGLARLGRVLSRDSYVARAKALYDFVRRQTSSFGWVPDFMAWQLPGDLRGDSACTAALLDCALDLVECNFPEYWEDANKIWRNQLVQLQIPDAAFVPKEKDIPAPKPRDTPRRTYKRVAETLPGAFCGATSPSFVFLASPRLVSARGSAEATRVMFRAWRNAVEDSKDIVTVNFPVNCETDSVLVQIGYPNEFQMRVEMRRTCRLNIRVYPWMGTPYEGTVDGRPIGIERREDHMLFPKLKKGSVAIFRHAAGQKHVLENVNSLDFYGIWRGPDMVDLLPHSTGPGYRLYQCALGVTRDPVPLPTSALDGSPEPWFEPPVSKETRLNRRKAPRT